MTVSWNGPANRRFVKDLYNREWRLEKLLFRSPLEARRAYKPTPHLAA